MYNQCLIANDIGLAKSKLITAFTNKKVYNQLRRPFLLNQLILISTSDFCSEAHSNKRPRLMPQTGKATRLNWRKVTKMYDRPTRKR